MNEQIIETLAAGFQKEFTPFGTNIHFRGDPPDDFEGGAVFTALAVAQVLDVVLPQDLKTAQTIAAALGDLLVPVLEGVKSRRAARNANTEEAVLVA